MNDKTKIITYKGLDYEIKTNVEKEQRVNSKKGDSSETFKVKNNLLVDFIEVKEGDNWKKLPSDKPLGLTLLSWVLIGFVILLSIFAVYRIFFSKRDQEEEDAL